MCERHTHRRRLRQRKACFVIRTSIAASTAEDVCRSLFPFLLLLPLSPAFRSLLPLHSCGYALMRFHVLLFLSLSLFPFYACSEQIVLGTGIVGCVCVCAVRVCVPCHHPFSIPSTLFPPPFTFSLRVCSCVKEGLGKRADLTKEQNEELNN